MVTTPWSMWRSLTIVARLWGHLHAVGMKVEIEFWSSYE